MAQVTRTGFEWYEYRTPWKYYRAYYRVCALPSEIEGAGSGLFTTEDIKKRTAIGEYVGQLLPDFRNEQVKKHFDNGYLMQTFIDGKRFYIDGSDLSRNIMGFANHANKDATERDIFTGHYFWRCNMICMQTKDGRCFFYARRDIKAGEELLFEYADLIEFTVVKTATV